MNFDDPIYIYTSNNRNTVLNSLKKSKVVTFRILINSFRDLPIELYTKGDLGCVSRKYERLGSNALYKNLYFLFFLFFSKSQRWQI